MKRVALAGLFVFALHGAAGAQGPIPDPWLPNNYVVAPAPGGGVVLGYDSRRWTFWQTQVDRRGNMYGFDVYGNYWTYNRRTNTYQHEAIEPRWQARCYTNAADFC